MKAIDLRGDRDGYKRRPVTREEYAPYHTMPEFQQGYDHYVAGIRPLLKGLCEPYSGVAGQAYDRGAEFAMRTERDQLKKREPWRF